MIVGEDPTDIERLQAKMPGWTRRRLGDQWMIIEAISGVELNSHKDLPTRRRASRLAECSAVTRR